MPTETTNAQLRRQIKELEKSIETMKLAYNHQIDKVRYDAEVASGKLEDRLDQCEAFIEQLNDATVMHSGKLADIDKAIVSHATRLTKMERRDTELTHLQQRLTALAMDFSGTTVSMNERIETALKLAHQALHASMEPEIEEIEDDLATPINEEEWAAWARSLEGYNAMRLVGQYLARGSK